MRTLSFAYLTPLPGQKHGRQPVRRAQLDIPPSRLPRKPPRVAREYQAQGPRGTQVPSPRQLALTAIIEFRAGASDAANTDGATTRRDDGAYPELGEQLPERAQRDGQFPEEHGAAGRVDAEFDTVLFAAREWWDGFFVVSLILITSRRPV